MSTAPVGTSKSGPRIPCLPILAALGIVAVAIGFAIVYFVRDGDDVSSPGPPPGLVFQSPTVSAPSEPSASPPSGDVTQAFRQYALIGQRFEPEWLIRVKRVYWTDNGALWANMQLPNSPTERTFTIEKVCGKLSEYVTNVAHQEWAGVSVRKIDGAELFTRRTPTDPCRPAAQ